MGEAMTASTDAGTDTGTDATSTTDTATDSTGTDTAAELDKWKAQARKHEERAKANANAAKELETIKQQHMTDTEKAVDQARKEGKAEALKESAARIARAEFRAAAAGRNVDIDTLIEAIDLGKFVDDEGEPDGKAIAAWLDKVAPKTDDTGDDDAAAAAAARNRPAVDMGQGTRSSSQSMALNGDPLLRALEQKVGARRR